MIKDSFKAIKNKLDVAVTGKQTKKDAKEELVKLPVIEGNVGTVTAAVQRMQEISSDPELFWDMCNKELNNYLDESFTKNSNVLAGLRKSNRSPLVGGKDSVNNCVSNSLKFDSSVLDGLSREVGYGLTMSGNNLYNLIQNSAYKNAKLLVVLNVCSDFDLVNRDFYGNSKLKDFTMDSVNYMLGQIVTYICAEGPAYRNMAIEDDERLTMPVKRAARAFAVQVLGIHVDVS